MFYPKVFISTLAVIILLHIVLFTLSSAKEKPTKIADNTTIIKIALKKVYIKQKEQKKAEPIEKKVEKKKVTKKNIDKIVKKAKRKIVKKKIRKIVKKKIKKRVIKKKIYKKTQKKVEMVTTEPVKKVRERPRVSDMDLLRYRYLRKLKRMFERYKIYPKDAKAMGQEGTVVVSFIIQADGRLTNVRITMECIYSKLNRAGFDIAKRIGRIDPIPKELNKKSWAIEVPVEYELPKH